MTSAVRLPPGARSSRSPVTKGVPVAGVASTVYPSARSTPSTGSIPASVQARTNRTAP